MFVDWNFQYLKLNLNDCQSDDDAKSVYFTHSFYYGISASENFEK